MNRGSALAGNLVAAFVLVTWGSSVRAGWDQYVARTLKSVIETNQGTIAPTSKEVYSASNFPSRVRVVYRGEVRSIPEPRLNYLARYLGEFRHKPEWVPLYAKEVLCREGDRDYWLPIQTSVLKFFKDEVKDGVTVELFVTWLGAYRNDGQLDWVFTINEFQVGRQQ